MAITGRLVGSPSQHPNITAHIRFVKSGQCSGRAGLQPVAVALWICASLLNSAHGFTIVNSSSMVIPNDQTSQAKVSSASSLWMSSGAIHRDDVDFDNVSVIVEGVSETSMTILAMPKSHISASP